MIEEGTETQTRTEATMVVYKPRREDSKEIHKVATWFSDVKLPNREKINFCLSCLFDGTLLGQPFQSRTPPFHTSSKQSHRNSLKSHCPLPRAQFRVLFWLGHTPQFTQFSEGAKRGASGGHKDGVAVTTCRKRASRGRDASGSQPECANP